MESVAVRTALLNDAQQANSPTGDQEYPLSSLVIPYVSSTCTECGRAVVGAASVVEIIGSGSSTGSIPSVRDVSFQRVRKHRSRSATAGPTTLTPLSCVCLPKVGFAPGCSPWGCRVGCGIVSVFGGRVWVTRQRRGVGGWLGRVPASGSSSGGRRPAW